MEFKKKCICYLVIFTLISCQKNQIVKEYYSSGELSLELEIDNDKLKNGYYKEFYKSGQLKKIANYNSDILVDTIIGYFESGKIQYKQFRTKVGDSCYKYKEDGSSFMKGKIEDNVMSGWWKVTNVQNDMTTMNELISIPENTVYVNQSITYKNEDIVDSLSTYYDIKVNDTIIRNVVSDIEFEYYSPSSVSKDEKISSSVNFYFSRNFNKNFTNKKQVKVDSLTLKSFRLKTNITFPRIGKNFIRGYFLEYESKITGYSKDSSDVNMELSENKVYFEREVFVIEK
jgi:hypothetical protein